MAKSAFGRAVKKAPAGAGKTAPNVFVAEDFVDPVTNEVLYSQKQVVDAINKLCEGKAMAKTAETLIETYDPIVKTVATRLYAQTYVNAGHRPEKAPKIVTSKDGTGDWITTAFKDAEKNMDKNAFDALAKVIGQKNAEAATIKRDEFSLNSNKLEIELDDLPEVEVLDDNDEAIKGPDGAPLMRKQTVMDLVDAAITEKFADRPGILDGLFTVKPVFKTKKGMIENLLDYVGKGTANSVNNLEKALKAARVTCSVTAGSVKAAKAGDADDDD